MYIISYTYNISKYFNNQMLNKTKVIENISTNILHIKNQITKTPIKYY